MPDESDDLRTLLLLAKGAPKVLRVDRLLVLERLITTARRLADAALLDAVDRDNISTVARRLNISRQAAQQRVHHARRRRSVEVPRS